MKEHFISAAVLAGMVALTCQAVNDAPETDDEIEFLAQNNVSVEANTTTESSFN